MALARFLQIPMRRRCERSEAIHWQAYEAALGSPRRQSRLATTKESVFVKGALAPRDGLLLR